MMTRPLSKFRINAAAPRVEPAITSNETITKLCDDDRKDGCYELEEAKWHDVELDFEKGSNAQGKDEKAGIELAPLRVATVAQAPLEVSMTLQGSAYRYFISHNPI